MIVQSPSISGFLVFLVSAPGFLWLLGAEGLAGMFKPLGLVLVVVVQIVLFAFMNYWNRINGLSRFVKVVVGAILVVTNVVVVFSVFETWNNKHCSECGWGSYMMAVGLAPVVSICFYLLTIKMIPKLVRNISRGIGSILHQN